MTEIGAFAAKNQFSKLLERAGRGEEFVITHRGKPVAKLVPATVGHDPAKAREALARLRRNAKGAVIGPPVTAEEILEWIREGRR
jgi:prevent-host-death family protein